jgi:succinate dehydrogenase/fumarate reductase flavoprotein subunit
MASNVMSCDLMVIGGGGSGLVAAVKAKDLGVKDVVVLETGRNPGGSTWFAGWGAGGYNKWQKEAGYPDTRDDSFRRIMKQYKWMINYKLIRNYVDYQGPFFDWINDLCDVSDFIEKPAAYVKPEGGQQGGPGGMGGGMAEGGMPGGRGTRKANHTSNYHMNKKSRDPSIGPGRGGSYLVARMVEQCQKMGIKILTETRAREFIKDAKGNVTGAYADTKDGKLQVNFKACVLAAGGLTSNREKLKKVFPQWFDNDNSLHVFCCPGSVGDSFDMAEQIGALVDYKNMTMEFLGPVHHPYSFTIYTLYMLPEGVYVNLNGERYISETDYTAGGQEPTVLQPKGIVYSIYDDDMIEGATAQILKQRVGEEWPYENNGLRRDIEEEVALDEAGVPGNRAKKANTFEELAKKMKVPVDKFVATMTKYNEYCEKGRDLDMAKDPKYLKAFKKPPYYAFFLQNFANTTHNGLVINENMELVNAKDNKGIPNLFAAGDNAKAMDGGMSWCPTSGYMAGIAAAKCLGAGPGLARLI